MRRRRSLASALLVPIAVLQWPLCFSWQHSSPRMLNFRRDTATISTLRLHATVEKQVDDDSISSVLNGVAEFERWFASVPGASCHPSIRHDDFGNLRGLMTGDAAALTLSRKDAWMTIPRSIVLQSDFSQPDWDVQLAQQLWRQVQSESKQPQASSISGYLALLTQGSSWREYSSVPPSTAPDALRHWSQEEKSLLSISPSGKRLLDLEQQQRVLWRNKFDQLGAAKDMTWEQFVWAMEVVHSRAFCGDFGIGSSLSNAAVNIAVPLVAGIAGFVYYVPLHGQNDAVLLGLAAVAAVPSLFNIVKQTPPVAVLLPLIDSANHLEEADSSIEYSSLNDSFVLSGGSKCLVKEKNGKQQLCISYGKKKDTELLLNYGFLRGVPSDGDATERRRRLAETFLNP
jgi:hypothetical protein